MVRGPVLALGRYSWGTVPVWVGGIYQVDLVQGGPCHLKSGRAKQDAEPRPLPHPYER